MQTPTNTVTLMASFGGICSSSQPTMAQLSKGMTGPSGSVNSPSLGIPSRWRKRSTARLTPRSTSSSEPVATTARYLNVPLNADTAMTIAKKIIATWGVLYFGCTFPKKLGRLLSSDDAKIILGPPACRR